MPTTSATPLAVLLIETECNVNYGCDEIRIRGIELLIETECNVNVERGHGSCSVWRLLIETECNVKYA